MVDYVEPLLELKAMLRNLESDLLARKWDSAVMLSEVMVAQARLLSVAIKEQASDQQ